MVFPWFFHGFSTVFPDVLPIFSLHQGRKVQPRHIRREAIPQQPPRHALRQVGILGAAGLAAAEGGSSHGMRV